MTAQVKIHRINVEVRAAPATAGGRNGLDRRFQTRRIGLLDGLTLVPSPRIHGHKARRRHRDLAGIACTQWRFAPWLWLGSGGLQQGFKIHGTGGLPSSGKKLGGVFDPLWPLDDMHGLDQWRLVALEF